MVLVVAEGRARWTHVRPVERRMPARMVETVQKGAFVSGSDAEGAASKGKNTVNKVRIRTQDSIDAVVDKPPELRP